MDPSLKRNILPMNNWKAFLEEGKKEFQKLVEMKSSSEYGREDFELIKILGMGAFGKVYLSRMKKNDNVYAVKVLDKEMIVKRKQVKHALNEKNILQALNHPFTVYLEYSFQDFNYLYLALPFIAGGEMFVHLRHMKRFDEHLTRFYTAQVLLAFEYLHYCDMIFRDLKPENLLIDSKGYVRVTDFGFCKVVKGRTYTMCGTPEYIAPEIILTKGYGKAVDWWAFGVLLYELASGTPPFHARDAMKIYEKAVACKYVIPKAFSAELEDLIKNLLQTDLSKRYGNLKDGVNDIKNHKWFKTINWISLFNGKLEPPFIPEFSGADESMNFDYFKEDILTASSIDKFPLVFDEF